ncbi:MAG: PilZ domain-containing protein [Burkholderiales bacterium]|nr:PilZ domain-containing protein [Burkholderiales bacterium]
MQTKYRRHRNRDGETGKVAAHTCLNQAGLHRVAPLSNVPNGPRQGHRLVTKNTYCRAAPLTRRKLVSGIRHFNIIRFFMSQSDNRAFQRVQFFRLPKEQEFVPVWVFNSHQPGKSIAGLVVNLSKTGIQVLTAVNEAPTQQHYRIAFLEEEPGAVSALPSCKIHLIWTASEQGLYTRSGFVFDELDDSTLQLLIDHMQQEKHAFLRCSLETADELFSVTAEPVAG